MESEIVPAEDPQTDPDAETHDVPKRKHAALPTFISGRPLTVEQMDEHIYQHIKERIARR
ncbi:MAG TPA: hypothetical protein VFX70_22705 [Mycobacteriales bacterium]|nr:hypothetical protein [Mycobacteriales bacterium]